MKDFVTLLVGLVICAVLIFLLLKNPIVIRAESPPPPPPPKKRGLRKSYVVQQGDTLWDISNKERFYGDPYLWPVIYWEKSNDAEIDDPDLILPNQVLLIRPIVESESRDVIPLVDTEEQQRARREAKTRGPWSLYDGR